MTTPATRADDTVAARLDALRSALTQPDAPRAGDELDELSRADGFDAADGPDGADEPYPLSPRGPTGRGELAERAQARRSAAHVAAAYSAAHGHPWHDDEPGRRRWALAPTTALAAAGVLLAVVLAVVAVAWPRGEVADLGIAVSSGAADSEVHPDRASGAGQEAGEEGADEAGPSGGQGADEAGADPAAAVSPAGSDVVVHVVGEVEEPGLVTLPAGSRVADAVDAAGGPTGKAELSAVNLARDVVDGEQVHVPAPGEEVQPAAAGAPAGAEAGAAAGAGGTTGAAGQVPLNTADATALTQLPGVGPVLAERILAWREEHGPFTSVDELTEVSGIGPAVLEGLRDQAVV